MILSRFSRILIFGVLAGSLHTAALLYAQVPAGDELSPYEQRLFSQSFQMETIENRLSRLETSIFGEQQTGNVSERRSRLMQILAKAEKVAPRGAASEPEAGNTETGVYSGNPDYPPQQRPAKLPDATDYPTVTALEREVFGRDFIFEPVDNRLSRLEKKVFRATYEHIALVDRVDKLLMRYPKLSGTTPEDYPNSAINSLPKYSGQFAGSRDTYVKVDALEQAFFNDRTFSEKLMTERLDALETKAFGHTYSGQSIDLRVDRLLKGFEERAGNNGGVQPRPSFESRPGYTNPDGSTSGSVESSYVPNTTRPPQNIQIGAGFSQSSTHSFSPELIEMLPDDVRSQLRGGQSGSTSRSVVSSPGTVVIERSTSGSYPGIQPFGSAPVQYRNYYGPSVSQSTTQTTTVIQPDGTAAVYTYENTPVYTGNPTIIQNLGNLEINVFGTVNTAEPVSIRLAKLEQILLGQAYPSYPEADRLAHLQKVYQYQSLGRLFGKSSAGNAGRQAGSMILGVPLSSPVTP